MRNHLFFAGMHDAAWGYSDKGVVGNAQQRRDLSPGAWMMLDEQKLLRFVGTLNSGLMKDTPEGRATHYELFHYREDE